MFEIGLKLAAAWIAIAVGYLALCLAGGLLKEAGYKREYPTLLPFAAIVPLGLIPLGFLLFALATE